jgi:hypothetical protein
VKQADVEIKIKVHLFGSNSIGILTLLSVDKKKKKTKIWSGFLSHFNFFMDTWWTLNVYVELLQHL